MQSANQRLARLNTNEEIALVEAMPSKLLPDIGTHLGRFLPDKNLNAVARSSKPFYQFFAHALQERILLKLIEFAGYGKQAKVQSILDLKPHFRNNKRFMLSLLLHHIAFGQQDEAEAILKAHPELLYMRGTVTDYANRTFTDITAFQLAFWGKDRHMWRMILKYLPKEEAAEQLKQHQSDKNPPDYVKAHGQHFDFEPIKAAYKAFINYANSVDWIRFEKGSAEGKELDRLWSVVACRQRELPVHVINEYCHPNRSFVVNDKTPNFDEETLPRVAKLWKGNSLFPLSSSSSWWGVYGLIRAGGLMVGLFREMETGLGGALARRDLAAVTRLVEVRTNESMLVSNQLNPTEIKPGLLNFK